MSLLRFAFLAIFIALVVAVSLQVISTGLVISAAPFLISALLGVLLSLLVLFLVSHTNAFQRIFGKLISKTNERANAGIDAIVRAATSVQNGDTRQAKMEAAKALDWVSETYLKGLYLKYVTGGIVAAIVALGSLLGISLLSAQNEKVEWQNEYSSIDLTEQIRNRFLGASGLLDKSFILYLEEAYIDDCRIRWNSDYYREEAFYVANFSTLSAVASLGKKSAIRADLTQALRNLLIDENGGVVLSALLTLEEMGETAEAYIPDSSAFGESIVIYNVYATRPIRIRSAINIVLIDSVLTNLTCENCNISDIINSVYYNNYQNDNQMDAAEISNSLLIGVENNSEMKAVNSIATIADQYRTVPKTEIDGVRNEAVVGGQIILGEHEERIILIKLQGVQVLGDDFQEKVFACYGEEKERSFCEYNKYFTCEKRVR